jgi:CDP-diglyceride synthetase
MGRTLRLARAASRRLLCRSGGVLAALLAQPPLGALASPLIALAAPWLWVAGAVWLAIAVALPWASVPEDGRAYRSPVSLLFGLLALPAAVVALLWLRETRGLPGLGTLFGLVWAMDIGAYFAGRAWGRRKLAPRLSPGKTVEGLLGGLLAALGVAVAARVLWPERFPAWPWWIGLCAVVALVSVAGDLYESRLKRRAGVKDSGRLLPGHGGVLDRVDSLLAAAPVFVLGLELLR